jgi:hypothetical protein
VGPFTTKETLHHSAILAGRNHEPETDLTGPEYFFSPKSQIQRFSWSGSRISKPVAWLLPTSVIVW